MKHNFIFSLLLVIFINVLNFLFFKTRIIEDAKITVTVSTTKPTDFWFVMHDRKIKGKKYITQRQLVSGNSKKFEISASLDSNRTFSSIGLVWRAYPKHPVNFYKIEIDTKKGYAINESPKNFITGTTPISNVTVGKNKLVINTTKDANNWIILNTNELEKARIKTYRKPLSIHDNVLILAVILLLLFWFKPVPDWNMLDLRSFKILELKTLLKGALTIWAFLFPFWVKSSTIFLIFSFLLSLVLITKSYNTSKVKHSLKIVFPTMLFFTYVIIYVLLNTNQFNDFIELSPLLFGSIIFLNIEKKDIGIFFKYLRIAIYIFIVIIFLKTLNESDYTTSLSTFKDTFQRILEQKWHSSYFSLFFLILIIYDIILNNRWTIITIIFSLIVTYLISAITAWGITLLLFSIYFIKVYRKIKRPSTKNILNLALIITLLIFINYYDYFFLAITDYLQTRFILWEAGLQILKESHYLGVGPNNVSKELQLIIDSPSIKFYQYNVHNQYLELAIAFGIPGLLLFILLIIMPIFKNASSYKYFILIFGISFIFESYLRRQAGIAIFTYWYYLFALINNPEQTKT